MSRKPEYQNAHRYYKVPLNTDLFHVHDKQLLMAAASARQKYMAYLDEEKKKKVADTNDKKRKLVSDEIEQLKIKKLRTI